MTTRLYNGDCLEVMKSLPADSVDTIIEALQFGGGDNPVEEGKFIAQPSVLNSVTPDTDMNEVP